MKRLDRTVGGQDPDFQEIERASLLSTDATIDVARVVTPFDHCAKLKAVAEPVNGVLPDGRRWFQHPKGFHLWYGMTDFVHDRLGPIELTKQPCVTKSKADEVDCHAAWPEHSDPESRTTCELVTADKALGVYPSLPKGVRWTGVTHCRVCLVKSPNHEIEPWVDVQMIGTDDLHSERETSGLPPSPLLPPNRSDPVKTKLGRRPLDEQEQTQTRSCVTGLDWVARQGHPDASAATSITALSFLTPRVAGAESVNTTIRCLPTTEDWPIDLRAITDFTFDTSGRRRSQLGWMIGYPNPEFALGKEDPVSMVVWKLRRLRQEASSSLLRLSARASRSKSDGRTHED